MHVFNQSQTNGNPNETGCSNPDHLKTEDKTMSKKYLSCAETAAMLRKALKEAFPGVKFSVKSKTYSGGASISVSWTDGPNEAQVASISGVFSGSYFDGSIDYKGSVFHMIDGQEVRFMADHVFTHREVSEKMAAPILARLAKKWGVAEGFDFAEYKRGNYWNKYPGNGGNDFQRIIGVALAKNSDRLTVEKSATAGKVVILGDDGYSRQCGSGMSVVSVTE